MKYIVNDSCIGCGFCEGACPHVFHINDSGVAVAEDINVNEEFITEADDAMLGCPVGAIEKIDE